MDRLAEGEIREAFRDKLAFKSQKYDLLCTRIQAILDQGKVESILELQICLNRCIPNLGKEFGKLIEIIFSFPCWFSHAALHENFGYFVTNLVSIHPFFAQNALKCIVEAFQLPEDSTENCNFEAVHDLLLRVFQVVPSMTPFLLGFLGEAFPHPTESFALLKAYLSNVLHVCDYLPLVRNQILELCIEKLVAIDGVIEDSEEAENSGQVFQKIEGCLCVFLGYLAKLHSQGELQCTFYALLITFERVLLRAFRLNWVQYYIFYLCSLDAVFCEHFLGMLFGPFANGGAGVQSDHISHTADICMAMTANYISSFVARAAFLEESCVIWSFHILLDWMENYLATWDDVSGALVVGDSVWKWWI